MHCDLMVALCLQVHVPNGWQAHDACIAKAALLTFSHHAVHPN